MGELSREACGEKTRTAPWRTVRIHGDGSKDSSVGLINKREGQERRVENGGECIKVKAVALMADMGTGWWDVKHAVGELQARDGERAEVLASRLRAEGQRGRHSIN